MNKDILIERISKAHAILETALAEFSEADTQATGTPERWSLKDSLAHITAWEKNFTDWLAPALDGTRVEGGPRFDGNEFDADNATLYAENKDRSWDEILEESRRVPALMVRILRSLPEADLNDPERFASSSALWRRIEGNFIWHVQSHLVELFARHNASARGLKYAEEFAALVGEDSPATERGVAVYNLACVFALSGQGDKAIPALKQAFELNPTLLEWSRQDMDLNSLRSRADFKGLYGDASQGNP